jgi:hypothetical protein
VHLLKSSLYLPSFFTGFKSNAVGHPEVQTSFHCWLAFLRGFLFFYPRIILAPCRYNLLPNKPTSVAWQAGGDLMALGSDSGHVALYNKSTASLCGAVSPVHSRSVNRLVFSPHG